MASDNQCKIFGRLSDLQTNILPTYGDVIKHYLWCESKCSFLEIAKIIRDIWLPTGIPIITIFGIKKRIQSYHTSYNKIIKSNKKYRSSENYSLKISKFREAGNVLFDISDKSKCVPQDILPFYEDQRGKRNQVIPKWAVERYAKLMLEKPITEKKVVADEMSDSSTSSSDTYQPVAINQGKKQNKQNRVDISPIIEQGNRFGVSLRATSAIASATLKAYGLINNNDRRLVIDKSKVQRQLIASREKVRHSEVKSLSSLYFDGRKDRTLTVVKINGKLHKTFVVEEHISLISEPSSKYVGHVTPTSGKASDITSAILNFLSEETIETSKLCAIGIDGTAVNTGWKAGIVRQLEVHFGRSLQWLVCQLHFNELPLRHLLINIDGKTTGPNSFTGPIGKILHTSGDLKVIKFVPIKTKLPPLMNEVIIDLSPDQRYLYEICKAVDAGFCSPDLANRKPGKISHARWLTLANNLMRLYVATPNPSKELVLLANYVAVAYAPTWFKIKCNSKCTERARNLWFLIKQSRSLSQEIRDVIDPVIQRNGFFGHPENLLISMLSDNRLHVRQLAVSRIIHVRQQSSNTIRLFQIPKFNFSAEDYIDLIEWTNCDINEPPILKSISEIDLNTFAENQALSDINALLSLPCHSQAVERCVKSVTEASMQVAGLERRDGAIRLKIKSRSEMAKFETKSDFKCANLL